MNVPTIIVVFTCPPESHSRYRQPGEHGRNADNRLWKHGLKIKRAEDGETFKPSVVYVAPLHYHLLSRTVSCWLPRARARTGSVPLPLFRSGAANHAFDAIRSCSHGRRDGATGCYSPLRRDNRRLGSGRCRLSESKRPAACGRCSKLRDRNPRTESRHMKAKP